MTNIFSPSQISKYANMVTQPNPVRHWPGGIPPSIRIHPDGERSENVEIEDCRGWLLFVKVSSAIQNSPQAINQAQKQEAWRTREDSGIPSDDTEYELRQRRFMIERWASAEQSFRDVSFCS